MTHHKVINGEVESHYVTEKEQDRLLLESDLVRQEWVQVVAWPKGTFLQHRLKLLREEGAILL